MKSGKGSTTDSKYVKSERVVSGMHFLTVKSDRKEDLLLPKSETGEPEVRKQVTQPAPLFKCHSCNAYFKSRKGYIGHLSSRHSDNENDENREEPTNKKARKTSDVGKGPDWEQQREKEEKLVADIIDRVKRECEAQGETVTRRGYSRRSTVMNS